MIVIDDPDDPRVGVFRLRERELSNRPQRRDDRGDGLFMAEGDLVVERALDAGCTPVVALVDRDAPPDVARRLLGRAPVYAGGDRLRAAVTRLGMPYDVVALFERPARPTACDLAASSRRLILVEAVDNPANIGSIVRNGRGLGWDGLVLDRTSADPLARRALRVSMGHAVSFPHARVDDLAAIVTDLRADGWAVHALAPSATTTLDRVEPAERTALVVGSERAGLTHATLAATASHVAIEMCGGVDSLNAAAATAVACWYLRQR